jgi:PhnB protein
MPKTKAVPKGYSTVTTYLNVKGANDVLTFMKKAFGAKVSEKYLNDDGSILHAEAVIGDTRIMVGDPRMVAPMTAMLYMYVPNCDAVYKKAMKAGGKSISPPADQQHGDRVAGVLDKGGNRWFIATRKKPVSKAMQKKRVKK